MRKLKQKPKHRPGFTLIDLMVTLSIISLLSSILLVSSVKARENAKYAKATKDLQTLMAAMQAYKGDTGELPPRLDFCNTDYCGGTPTTAGWTVVIDALLNNDGSNWKGPYLGGRIDLDPWGHYYGYDDNDVNSNCGDSWIYSVGSGTGPYVITQVASTPAPGTCS